MISVAVKKSNRACRNRWSEIERVDVCPSSRRQAGRIGAVLKIHPLGNRPAGSAESPLLARVSNIERSNGCTCIVLEGASENRDERAAAHLAQALSDGAAAEPKL
jgi:hypothetical protein